MLNLTRSANPACLHAFSKYDNVWKSLLPDHPPEVRNGVRHRSWNKILMHSYECFVDKMVVIKCVKGFFTSQYTTCHI